MKYRDKAFTERDREGERPSVVFIPDEPLGATEAERIQQLLSAAFGPTSSGAGVVLTVPGQLQFIPPTTR
jgi:hypothetical protein